MKLPLQPRAARITAIVIAAIAGIEGTAIAVFHQDFIPPVLSPAALIPAAGWIAAVAVTAAYIALALRGLPAIREHLFDITPFKLWGIALAVPSAVLEEVFFRQSLMNAFAHHALVVQITVSALAFGAAHAFWALRGGRAAFAGAVGSTTALGATLAAVFILSNRLVLPCVAAHFVINAVLEPWLLYAYVMRSQTPKALSPPGAPVINESLTCYSH